MRCSILFLLITINFYAQQVMDLTSFGAIPDDGVEDTNQFIKAMQYCSSKNRILNIPRGQFIINSNEKIDIQCSIQGLGTVLNKGNYLVIKKKNTIITDITIKGGIKDNIGKGLYILADNVRIVNVKIFNVKEGGISSEGVENLTIRGCSIGNCKGKWGDGILLLRSINCLIENNYINNVQRIGIVADTNVPELKCKNIKIINNKIINSSAALDGELNGGIWVENTYNAKISNNKIENTADRGIVIAPVIKDNNRYEYFVTDNFIKNTKYAIALSGEVNNANFYILNNTISGNFERGLTTGANFNSLILDNSFFDTSQNGIKDFSLIYVDMYGAWRKSYLEITGNNKKDNPLKKDIVIYNGRFLKLNNKMKNWGVSISQ